MGREGLRLVARVIYDFDLARLHNEEVHVSVAHRKKRLPVPEHLRLGMGATCQLTDLRLIKGGECDRQKVVFVHSSKLNLKNQTTCNFPMLSLLAGEYLRVALAVWKEPGAQCQ